MVPYDLTNEYVSNTFGRVVQCVGGSLYNGLGDLIPSASLTAALALTSSYNLNSVSSSFASTASYVLNSSPNSVSSSFASTASYVNPLHQTVEVTGSLSVNTGNILVVSGDDYTLITPTDIYKNNPSGGIVYRVDTNGTTTIGNSNFGVSNHTIISQEDITKLDIDSEVVYNVNNIGTTTIGRADGYNTTIGSDYIVMYDAIDQARFYVGSSGTIIIGSSDIGIGTIGYTVITPTTIAIYDEFGAPVFNVADDSTVTIGFDTQDYYRTKITTSGLTTTNPADVVVTSLLDGTLLCQQVSASTITANFIGNLTGTSSYTTSAKSSSFASTSSYVNTLNQTVSASNFYVMATSSMSRSSIVGNGSISNANINKSLCIASDGTLKAIDDIAKGFLARGMTPYEYGLGETSTTTRFTTYNTFGGTISNGRGWPLLTSISSTSASYVGFAPIAGSANVFPHVKYGHPAYGFNLSNPIMTELDLIFTTTNSASELYFYLSPQDRTIVSSTYVSGSTTVTVASTSSVRVGHYLSGTGTPSGNPAPFVDVLLTPTTYKISRAPTTSGTDNWSYYGVPDNVIQNKGYGWRLKGAATIRLETHDGSTALSSSYFATTVSSSYVAASSLCSKIRTVSSNGIVYLYANESLITSMSCPTGISTSGNTSNWTPYMLNLSCLGVSSVSTSNPRLYY